MSDPGFAVRLRALANAMSEGRITEMDAFVVLQQEMHQCAHRLTRGPVTVNVTAETVEEG
jgi:hypothetical protein